MAIKNIEMSVYNGSSYDTLLPVTSSENVTIASAISGLFGLGADSTLTDILQKLSNAVIWDGSSTELPNGSSIVTGARIETGSYVGTGTYGASNPCSLTFEFQPKIFAITAVVEKSKNRIGSYDYNIKPLGNIFTFNSIYDLTNVENAYEKNFYTCYTWNSTPVASYNKITIQNYTLTWYIESHNELNENSKYQLNYKFTNSSYTVDEEYTYYYFAIG